MMRICLPVLGSVAAWRQEARRLARAGIPSEAVLWQVGEDAADLFAAQELPRGPATDLRLPRAAIASMETALHHSDPERFARAYDLVLRLSQGRLRWGDRSDRAMAKLLAQEKGVRRDIHKMHAFVRFREVTPEGAKRRAFAAWFEPEHPITEAAVPFFAKRFGDMDWVIATPLHTARFVNGVLAVEETRDPAPLPEDAAEELWRTYYAHIFNPARLMVSAMTSEMPRKYWKNLPEARLIPELIRTAPARAEEMRAKLPTLPPPRVQAVQARLPDHSLPQDVTPASFKAHLDACTRCPLGGCATQGVAGEGPRPAALMVVGEQPGDAEDLAGRPFVGPAGQMFDACAAEAGLDRGRAYVTNAVKHFKFAPRGKRRLHQRPGAGEVMACKWWLGLERSWVQPRLTLAMGATAALALTGSGERLLQRRGTVERAEDGGAVLLTLHPSYLLRLPDEAAAARARAEFTADLARAADFLDQAHSP
ncbi:UdgX family uracil-DNA binding protein [Salipiger marinus]|uniref:UdgX family uracil-DNA binding protein n=2 Tax=Salipiger marinus TaxID=555512 RepID=UPI003639FA29